MYIADTGYELTRGDDMKDIEQIFKEAEKAGQKIDGTLLSQVSFECGMLRGSIRLLVNDYEKSLEYYMKEHYQRCLEVQALKDEVRDLKRKLNQESDKYADEQANDALSEQWWQHQDENLSQTDLEEIEG